MASIESTIRKPVEKLKKATMERREREAKLKGSNCFNIACFDDTLECFSLRKSFRDQKNRWSFRKSSRALQQEIRPPLIGPAPDFAFLSNHRSYGLPDHQNKQALAVAAATAAAAEAAVAAAQAAAHVAQLTGTGCSKQGNLAPLSPILELLSREDMAAIKIQSAFRGYLARKSLGALKGRQRLQALARGRVGQRQTKATLRCMQALVRAQAAARGRRPRLCDEEALATLLHPWERHEASVTAEEEDHDGGKCRREKWDVSTQTVEEVHARLQEKHDAVIKRERAMAYALISHQQLMGRSQYSNRSSQLGWNWLERWMAARPWENRRPPPAKELPPPVSRHLPPARGPPPPRGSFSKRTMGSDRRATMTPVFNRVSAPPKRLPVFASSGGGSLASASLRDDLSVASFSGTPSYMATTESARAKLRSHSAPKQRLAPAGVSDRPRYSARGHTKTKF